ncbi:MAG TPA: hypothetical protein VII92_11175, partial [Anaerolineae bacterium]
MMQQQPMKKHRPFGITILAILAFIGGVVALLGGIAAIGLGGLAASVPLVDPSVTDADPAAAAAAAAAVSGLGGLSIILGVILLVTALLDLLFAFGAWGLKKWALTLGIIAQLLSLGSTVYNITQGTPLST